MDSFPHSVRGLGALHHEYWEYISIKASQPIVLLPGWPVWFVCLFCPSIFSHYSHIGEEKELVATCRSPDLGEVSENSPGPVLVTMPVTPGPTLGDEPCGCLPHSFPCLWFWSHCIRAGLFSCLATVGDFFFFLIFFFPCYFIFLLKC